jgi:serine/threonine protein kinase/regulator of sirC expression with transglutaminase-like and TPR domain
MPTMLGQTLRARYQILQQLGSGGFGETYLAEDRDLPGNPLCVVKQLKPKDRDPLVLQTARRLFDREAEALYRLGNHDRIPQLFAHFEENQEFYLVQEYIEGEALCAELASSSKPASETQIIGLLQDVLETLVFVHQQNAIHRDIKPSNLIRRRVDGKLIDFGAVKEIKTLTLDRSNETSYTILVGSPGYMPNEQQGGKPRFSSDIYALGMTAIETLTRIAPEQLQEDPQTGEISWREYAGVSDRLAAILDKMVRTHFRDRYQSAIEVLHDLKNLQNYTAAPTQYFVLSKLRQQQFVKSPQLFVIIGTAIATLGLSKLLHIEPMEINSIVPATVATPTPTPKVPAAAELFNQANTLVELQRYDEAIATLDQALQLEQNYPQAWLKRGEALGAMQKYDEALKAFDEALKLKSDLAIAWSNRGAMLVKLQRYDEALTALDKAVELDSTDAKAWYERGMVLQQKQRNEAAVDSFNRAVQNQPDYAIAWYQRGSLLNQLERYEDALTSLAEAVQLQPTDTAAWVERGLALGKLQRYEEAIASLDQALEINPNSGEAWGKRGEILAQLKRYDEALASLDKAVQIKSDDASAWYYRGRMLERLQRYEEAIAAYERVAQIKPDDSQAWYRRGVVLEKMHKFNEAIAAYDKAIQIWPANQDAIAQRKKLLTRLRR